jgi:hypothetical protein
MHLIRPALQPDQAGRAAEELIDVDAQLLPGSIPPPSSRGSVARRGCTLRHGDGAERLAHPQSGHDPRYVRYQVLRQVADLGTGIGDDLFALAERPADARAFSDRLARVLERGLGTG